MEVYSKSQMHVPVPWELRKRSGCCDPYPWVLATAAVPANSSHDVSGNSPPLNLNVNNESMNLESIFMHTYQNHIIWKFTKHYLMQQSLSTCSNSAIIDLRFIIRRSTPTKIIKKHHDHVQTVY